MLNILLVIILSIAGVIVGGLIAYGMMHLHSYLEKRRLIKNKPNDPGQLLDPGSSPITQKEVEEHDRRNFDKVREYERIRRIADAGLKGSGKAGTTKARPRTPERNELFEGGRLLPPKPDFNNGVSSQGIEKRSNSNPRHKKRIKFN